MTPAAHPAKSQERDKSGVKGATRLQMFALNNFIFILTWDSLLESKIIGDELLPVFLESNLSIFSKLLLA